MKDVERAFDKFNATLHRFDCMLAVDTASATRPFSPNGSCADCRVRSSTAFVVSYHDRRQSSSAASFMQSRQKNTHNASLTTT
ncbi:unnamed protein product [Anisakis simplex]|uniref:Transposase n=1 Tax=Anisakis simplex TaxID=6269 RepID=A0A0M3JQ47_ANISI|nr:unnamed protein product [Anisakis simplex]